MIKRILIPVDFSKASHEAARWGIDLANQLAAEVLVLSVLDVGDLRVAMKEGLHGFETDEDVRRQVHEWVEAQYAKIIPAGAKNVRRDLRRGMVDHELKNAIAQYEPDLIVMGSVGITRRLPLGSKTEFVMRHSKVPVVIIRD